MQKKSHLQTATNLLDDNIIHWFTQGISIEFLHYTKYCNPRLRNVSECLSLSHPPNHIFLVLQGKDRMPLICRLPSLFRSELRSAPHRSLSWQSFLKLCHGCASERARAHRYTLHWPVPSHCSFPLLAYHSLKLLCLFTSLLVHCLSNPERR